MDDLLRLFQEKGEKLTLKPNERLSLQKDDAVWFVEMGDMNLFAIELKNGEATGIRTFLSNCYSPSLFFCIEKEHTFPILEVFAIAETEVTVWEMRSLRLFEALETTPSLRPPFMMLLETWIHHIASYAEKADVETHTHLLTPSQTKEIAPNETFSIQRALATSEQKSVVWVTIRKGKTLFLGNPLFEQSEATPLFPLTHHLWLKATLPTTIETHPTEQLIDTTAWATGLAFFHTTLFRYYLTFRQEKKEHLVSKLQDKIEEDEKSLHSVFKEMLSLINPETAKIISVSKDPLFQACQVLGKMEKIEFVMPTEGIEKLDLSKQLSKIANTSRIRHRAVKLTKNWWKNDAGTLLGILTENQKPVVLKRRWGFYEIVDPDTRKRKRLTEELARKLHPFAFTFYRPFPDTLKTAKEAITFYLQTHAKNLIPILVYGSIGSLISLFVPFATANIFSRAIPDASLSILVQLCLGLFIAALSSVVFIYLRTLGLVRISGYASNALQAALWDRLLKLPVSFFRKFTTGNLVQRVNSIEQIKTILSDNSSRILLAGIFSFFYLFAMFLYSPTLSLVSLLLMSFAIAISTVCFFFKLRFERRIQLLTNTINGVLVQIISGVGKLRIAGAENNAFAYWANLFTKLKGAQLSAQTVHNVVLAVAAALPLLAYAFIFGFVMKLKESGDISLATFLGFNAAYLSFSTAIFEVSSAIMQMVSIPPLWKNVRSILDEEPERIVEKGKTGRLVGNIRADNISFRYESQGHLILDSISIHVDPKEFIAIVGPSGSGKSTLVRLLLGFETPETGTIYYDGRELSSLNLHDVRRQIGVVMQGSGLISGSLHDNLVCGTTYSKSEIDEALLLSGFAKDLHTFPMGLHTFIPMGGETLSGGQKQRLLIARALLPRPKILIFDEATSALDNKVQDEISRNLDALDVTRVVIAHRLSTIKHADRIYVLEKGRIIQTGTFEELAHTPGLFANMLKRQRL